MLLGLFVVVLLTKQPEFRIVTVAAVVVGLVLNLGEDFMFGVNGLGTLFWVTCLLGTNDTHYQVSTAQGE